MHIRYDDITGLTAEAPMWWLQGVPRYRSFRPDDLNVYANEVVLMRVECQMCFRQFDIGQYIPSAASFDKLPYHDDPPSHSSDREEYCGGGSMGVTELQILEFWRRTPFDPSPHAPNSFEWVRDHAQQAIYDSPM